MSYLIEAPTLIDHGGFEGAPFKVGDTEIFVFDIEEDADSQGRTIITGHDNDGNEVEVRFYPEQGDA